MQPLISVIVPVYNGESYLANCIASIQAQTYEPLEIIVINDGSTDCTSAVCEKIKAEDPRFHFVTTEDVGVSAARNHGIAMAKGELLTFVDADDRIHPQMLQRLYDVMVQTGSEITGCAFGCWTTERECAVILNSVPAKEGQTKIYQKSSYLMDEILNGNSRCWSKLYQRAPLERMKEHTDTWFIEGLTIGEDMLFLVQLLSEVTTLAEISFKGYGYYQNSQGAMMRSFRPEYMDQIRCWEMARLQAERLVPESDPKVTSHLLVSIMLTAGKIAALPGKLRKENKRYVEACREAACREKKNKKAVRMLSRGYRCKLCFFVHMPWLYLWSYHWLKRL